MLLTNSVFTGKKISIDTDHSQDSYIGYTKQHTSKSVPLASHRTKNPPAIIGAILKLTPFIDILRRFLLVINIAAIMEIWIGWYLNIPTPWNAAWWNISSDMCAQRRLKSACASTQSDQSLCCPHEETLHPWLSKIRPVKILVIHRLIWIFAARIWSKVGFLTLRLKYCALLSLLINPFHAE